MITVAQQTELHERIAHLEHHVGHTPLFRISRVFHKPGVEIYAKLEWQQLGGSVKARPAFNMIKQAIANGELHAGKSLLDATSGNTGIAYAAIGAALGIPVTLCLPENASQERKLILKAYGVNVILTSPYEGTDGAQLAAKELFAQHPDRYFYADQYANPNNWKAHYLHTANEIWEQTHGKITHFVAGLGTSGTFMGTTRRLKELNPTIQAISLQPDAPMHGLEGWKHMETAIVPKIYRPDLADQLHLVDSWQAFDLIKTVARTEGLLISPSAAANLLGAINLAKKIDHGTIVTVFADNAEKYGEVMREVLS